jgi:hypothetical protein
MSVIARMSFANSLIFSYNSGEVAGVEFAHRC